MRHNSQRCRTCKRNNCDTAVRKAVVELNVTRVGSALVELYGNCFSRKFVDCRESDNTLVLVGTGCRKLNLVKHGNIHTASAFEVGKTSSVVARFKVHIDRPWLCLRHKLQIVCTRSSGIIKSFFRCHYSRTEVCEQLVADFEAFNFDVFAARRNT